MSRHIPVIAACAATLAFSALPASAMTSHVHDFAIPGVHGARAWGTYSAVGTRVRVTVCVEDTARGVYGAVTAGLAFDSGYRSHDIVSRDRRLWPHPVPGHPGSLYEPSRRRGIVRAQERQGPPARKAQGGLLTRFRFP